MIKSISRLYTKGKSHIEKRLSRDFIDNGIATIPCKINEYGDVISKYSVNGCETLNSEFDAYIKETVDVIPAEYPVVINLVGGNLTDKEKKTIEETIKDDFAYNLGMVEKELKYHRTVFVLMSIGVILTGILLWRFNIFTETPRELMFIVLWYMADTLVDYLFIGGYDLKRSHMLAGRLALTKVVFSDKYDDSDYTKKEAEAIIDEIKDRVLESE